MTTIVLGTTNEGKVRELRLLLSDPRIELVSLAGRVPPDFSVEETGSTFEENAWLKALAVTAATGLPALAEDSGLEVDALGGAPGVYSARFAGEAATDAENNVLLLERLRSVGEAERTARFVSVLALAVPGERGAERRFSARGELPGRITQGLRGEGGFGYDPLFAPVGFAGRTTAQLSLDDKNRISHRGQAARTLLPLLSAWLDQAEATREARG